ncbi:hypothetical protein KIN20_033888 [Parelaphostrongylus tenuis]|uniref:Uncharacterized protein n=1 Tax=Parelaphostrongylus tenuis TaxID=148309 RepID=A0AAD5WJL2_PARTN|nr:hypothetical protein KIN20_033888 [Parelaphostrongylus tenuis]
MKEASSQMVDETSFYEYKVPLFTEMMDIARDYSTAHQCLAMFMVNKGVVTEQIFRENSFYIRFLRYAAVFVLKRHRNVVCEIHCTIDDLNGLVELLLEQLNAQLSALGFRLKAINDEESGHEFVVLVNEDISGRDVDISGFTADEMALFSFWLRDFVEGNGARDRMSALNEASKLKSSMTLLKTQQFMDKLERNRFISMKGGDMVLAPRAIAELEPLLLSEYRCPRCCLCQKVVIQKNLAVLCSCCDVYTHRHCWLKFASSFEADEVSCPAKSWNKCKNMFSKSDVAEAWSSQST